MIIKRICETQIFCPEYRSDLEDKLQTYNKTNEAIRRHFGKQKMNKEKN